MPEALSALARWRNWWATPLVGLAGGYLASLIGGPLPWIIGSLLAVIAVRCSGWRVTELPGGRQTGQWLAVLLPAGALLALLWKRFRQPNPWMLGPLSVCAAASVGFDLHLGLPPGLGQVGQWLIGCALGCHFDRAFFRSAPGFLARILLFTLLAMLGAALLAAGLSWLATEDATSLALGMMPGGITELCLTAEALHLSVALVTALQVLRLFLVMFLAEPLFRLWQRA